MKIQYCSDLHLEFRENKQFLDGHPLVPEGDVLLLAGDIVPFAIMNKQNDFFRFVAGHFEYTYWIPGNHEYYHFDAANKSGTIKEMVRSNVFLVNNISVRHGDTRLIFSTLWSKISAANEWFIERGVSDFQEISFNGKQFSSVQFNQLHEDSLRFIKEETARPHTGKTIVVTHHVPTFLNYPEQYKGDVINEAFAVELFDFIESSGIDYWIYGHHHNNTPDFTIGKTQMLTNQLGYVKYGEHRWFKGDKVMII